MKRRNQILNAVVAAVIPGSILALSATAPAAPVPISVTGWNAGIIVPNQPTFATHTMQGLTRALVENGATGYTGTGLPAETTPGTGVTANSAYTNPITGGNTQFFFQPYGSASYGSSNNDLQVQGGATITTGTLSLVAPGAYSNLAVLGLSASGSTGNTANLLITYQDGSTLSGVYSSTNWTTSVAPYTSGHSSIGIAGTYTASANFNPTIYNTSYATQSNTTPTNGGITYMLYETDINLVGQTTSLGDDATTEPISSITFSGYSTTQNFQDILALSGTQSVPEPATAGLLAVVSLGLLKRRRRGNAIG